MKSRTSIARCQCPPSNPRQHRSAVCSTGLSWGILLYGTYILFGTYFEGFHGVPLSPADRMSSNSHSNAEIRSETSDLLDQMRHLALRREECTAKTKDVAAWINMESGSSLRSLLRRRDWFF